MTTFTNTIAQDRARRGVHLHFDATWVAQAALAALFIFAGATKFIMPLDDMSDASGLPGALLLFVGACELLGGLALALPQFIRAARVLAPIAAAGLVGIMIGAVIDTIVMDSVIGALFPAAVGVVCLYVAVVRRSWLRIA